LSGNPALGNITAAKYLRITRCIACAPLILSLFFQAIRVPPLQNLFIVAGEKGSARGSVSASKMGSASIVWRWIFLDAM
jgi:hypothetical protein